MARTTFFVMACCIALAVAAVVSVLSRDIVPVPAFEAKPLPMDALIGPSSNIDGKRDKLAVAPPPDEAASLLRTTTEDGAAMPAAPPIAGPVPLPRARNAFRPAVQKNYTLLSETQIAAIKGRLRLTAEQEALWPDVEAALRGLAKAMHDKRLAGGAPAIEAESSEVETLKTAATPLLAKLREDQKREMRNLARLVGLEVIASQI